MALKFALLYVAFLLVAAVLFRLFRKRIIDREYRKLVEKSQQSKSGIVNTRQRRNQTVPSEGQKSENREEYFD